MLNRVLKTLACASLLIIIAPAVFSQENTVPALKTQLSKHADDTTGVEILRQLSLQTQALHPDSALLYAQRGLELSRKLSYKRGEANSMNRLGVVLWRNGKYDQALSFLINSLKIREQIGDQAGMLKSLSDIGIVYSDQNDNNTALSYHFKAKAIAEKLNDRPRLGIVLANIGNCYVKLNKVDSALNYEMQAYAIKQALKDTATLTNTVSILGDIHYKMGHDDLALDFYHLSIAFAKKTNDQSSLADTYNSVAKLFDHEGQPDSCVYYAGMALAAAKTAMYPEGIYNASNLLTNVYRGKNDHLELVYLKAAVAAKDSMFNAEKIKQIQILSFNEAARQEEIAEEKHRRDEERLITLQIIGIALFIPFFFLIVLWLSRTRTHRKVVEFMSVLSLLLLFEFITLLIHPFVLRISNHLPILELFFLIALASILVPLHHRLTHWMRERLTHAVPHHLKKAPAPTADGKLAE